MFTATTAGVLGAPDAVGRVTTVVLAAVAALTVHTLGHYYAGRRIAGIPAASITVDPRRPLQHVALEDDDGWITAVVVPAALLLATAGFPVTAGLVVVGSLLATALLVALDAATTQVRGRAAGDYSALWGIERRVPVLILLGVILVHCGVFWVVA
jgi:hypothetical protein